MKRPNRYVVGIPGKEVTGHESDMECWILPMTLEKAQELAEEMAEEMVDTRTEIYELVPYIVYAMGKKK